MFISFVFILFIVSFILNYVNGSFQIHLYSKFFVRLPIGFAGIPPTIVYSGTSFVTTAPAATTAPFPIVIPFRITQLTPSHA